MSSRNANSNRSKYDHWTHSKDKCGKQISEISARNWICWWEYSKVKYFRIYLKLYRTVFSIYINYITYIFYINYTKQCSLYKFIFLSYNTSWSRLPLPPLVPLFPLSLLLLHFHQKRTGLSVLSTEHGIARWNKHKYQG